MVLSFGIRLVLQELRLRGYGPYREEVSYPLDQRGLVLLTGKNLDDSAADSNAAGICIVKRSETHQQTWDEGAWYDVTN